ncbi:hypothetical protein NL676_029244 [Syzygium grande]|nr:hypothetical protein NL676_029244 [Syzygium grande]
MISPQELRQVAELHVAKLTGIDDAGRFESVGPPSTLMTVRHGCREAWTLDRRGSGRWAGAGGVVVSTGGRKQQLGPPDAVARMVSPGQQ